MKLITERSLIRGVAQRWREQYPLGRAEKFDEIYCRLAALNAETATAEEIEKIIGNSSWTDVPSCDECGERRGCVVELGEEPDYESRTAQICLGCLHKAINLKAEA